MNILKSVLQIQNSFSVCPKQMDKQKSKSKIKFLKEWTDKQKINSETYSSGLAQQIPLKIMGKANKLFTATVN